MRFSKWRQAGTGKQPKQLVVACKLLHSWEQREHQTKLQQSRSYLNYIIGSDLDGKPGHREVKAS